MVLTDVRRTPTVLALMTGATVSAVAVLIALVVLLQDGFAPGCGPGFPGRDASTCDVNGTDVSRMLPYAGIATALVVLTGLLTRRVLRHEQRIGGSARWARRQVGIAVGLPAFAVVGLIAVFIFQMNLEWWLQR
ncbi:hypothetical protein [Nocardioides sp.]|uniref:hypothetical protein n=1 Tax=Nocardioides sp. TaxID=35761 RepID=UPI0035137E4A